MVKRLLSNNSAENKNFNIKSISFDNRRSRPPVILYPKWFSASTEPPHSLRVFAFGEVASVRCVITNKFALHSLTRNYILFKRESLNTIAQLLNYPQSKPLKPLISFKPRKTKILDFSPSANASGVDRWFAALQDDKQPRRCHFDQARRKEAAVGRNKGLAS